jgi:hypothetical protein
MVLQAEQCAERIRSLILSGHMARHGAEEGKGHGWLLRPFSRSQVRGGLTSKTQAEHLCYRVAAHLLPLRERPSRRQHDVVAVFATALLAELQW